MAKPSLAARFGAAWTALAGGSVRSDSSPRGARSGRRSALFEDSRQHLNAVIAGAGPRLRGRCRFLSRENAYVGNMKEVWTNYAVGPGWTPSLVHDNPAVKAAWHAAWKVWTDSADFDGLMDLYGLQALGCDEEFEAGEVFFRLILSPDRPLQLQAIESEQLPYSNLAATGYALPPGHEIRLGIEFDGEGRRVGYHFHKVHPGDGTKMDVSSADLIRVPANEVIHMFRPRRAGQLRGYSHLAGAIVPMFKLEEYEDALLERAAQSAKYIGTIQRVGTGEDPPPAADTADGAREYTLETGILYELDDGEKIEFTTPPDPGSQYDEFTRRGIAKGCAAVGVPYAEVSGDLKSANFSSTRIGRQPFRRKCERWGNQVLVFQMLRVVWREFVRWSLLTNSVDLPRGASRSVESYLNVNWRAPRWEYVNPKDDASADKIMVDEGFKPRSAVQEENGYNAEEVDAQIAADRRREETLKLNLGARTAPAKPAADADDNSETKSARREPGDQDEGGDA